MRSGQIPPQVIRNVAFNFDWDVRKVWALDVPTESMPTEQLTWHFDLPFLWSRPNGYFDITPNQVLQHPDEFIEHWQRVAEADLRYPIDVMWWNHRWVILDGLHRLMRQAEAGATSVQVRKIPESAIPLIQSDEK